MKRKPNTVSKSELKAKMLEYFRRVERTRKELIVTDHGKPVLKVVPMPKWKSTEEAFADWKGKVKLPSTEELLKPEWPEEYS